MMEIICVVSGRVQGVGYRDYVTQAAQECEVNGYVANDSTGTVTVCAQGTPAHLKDFIEYLHEGSVTASVEHVAVQWLSAETVFDDFSVSR